MCKKKEKIGSHGQQLSPQKNKRERPMFVAEQFLL